MPGINQATVGDGYTAAATVQDVFTSTGGWFSVASQPVVLQLQWGPNSSGSRWSDEQTLGSGAFGTIPPGCTGIRFRNLVAGKAATVTAYIGAGGPAPDPRGNVWPEPALAISALGSVTTSGTAPTQTVLTRASVSPYVTPAGCVAILVECIAGGGAGGGAVPAAAGQAGGGGGGGGGGYAALLIASPAASYAFVVGAGGAGVLGGGGGAGGDTTFGAGPSVGAKGGSGGSTDAGGGLPLSTAAGGGAGFGQTGALLLTGSPGAIGSLFSANNYIQAAGGAAPRGSQGAGYLRTFGGSDGAAGPTPGGGGSGAVQTFGGGVNRTGGKGGDGVIIVTEFY